MNAHFLAQTQETLILCKRLNENENVLERCEAYTYMYLFNERQQKSGITEEIWCVRG